MRECRVCGCTDENACLTAAGPCHWVEYDLCSACDDAEDALAEGASAPAPSRAPAPEGGFFCDEMCPARPLGVHAPLYLDNTSGYCAHCKMGFVT